MAKKYMKKCEYCGTQFETNRKTQKYCSNACYQYKNQRRKVKARLEKVDNEKEEAYQIARANVENALTKKDKKKFEIQLIDELTDNGADIVKFWYDITQNNLIIGGKKMIVTVAQMMKANEQLQLIRWGKPKQQSVPSGKMDGGRTQVNITMFGDKEDTIRGQIVNNKEPIQAPDEPEVEDGD